MKRILFLSLALAACAHTKEGPVSPGAAPLPPPVRMELKHPPLLGTTPAGDRIYLGGLSGLRYLGKTANGKLRFLSLTDRGPTAGERRNPATGVKRRPFLLPGFQPRFLILLGDPVAGTLTVEKQIPLRRPDGKKLTGISQKEGQEKPVDSLGKDIPYDPYGMDLESVAPAAGGGYLAVDEYGPTVARFSANGKLTETLKPGSGLPIVFEQRRSNRGFEGGALLGNRLYVVMQSPLDNPRSERERNSRRSSIIRIAEVDVVGRRTLGQYIYVLGGGSGIRDLAVEGPRSLLLVEENRKGYRRVFRVSLSQATNLQLLPDRIAGPGGTLEGLKPEELVDAGITPVRKEELLDLAAAGVEEAQVEGIDVVEDSLAVAVDNGYGLDGTWDAKTGKVGFKNVPSVVYLFPPGSWRK